MVTRLVAGFVLGGGRRGARASGAVVDTGTDSETVCVCVREGESDAFVDTDTTAMYILRGLGGRWSHWLPSCVAGPSGDAIGRHTGEGVDRERAAE